jgi:hypothetical protein
MAATITDLSRRADQGFALPGLFSEAHALLMAWLTAMAGQIPEADGRTPEQRAEEQAATNAAVLVV